MHTTDELDSVVNQTNQWREWVGERIGQFLMMTILLLALAGTFGNGLLSRSRTEATSGNPVVEFESVIRVGAPTQITVSMPHRSGASQAQLSISRSFLDGAKLDGVVPPPTDVEVADDWVAYGFRTPSDPVTKVVIRFRPEKPGRLEYEIGPAGGSAVRIQQTVLP